MAKRNLKAYIMGNLELHFTAIYSPEERDVGFPGGIEIEDVKLADGTEIEIDDIYIALRSRHTRLDAIPLDEYLMDVAADHAGDD